MTDITDSESQAIWDKHRKAPHIDTFEEFKKKKEPEKKGWLSRQLSGIGSSYATALEAEAGAEPMYQGMIENVPALAAGFATLPFHAWGVLENALRGRGGEGQREHYPDIKPSAPFHLPVGTSLMDTGMTPEQLAQAVQSRVYQPQSEEGQQIQERIAQGGDFLTENIIRPVSRFVASTVPGDNDYLENLVDQLMFGRIATLNPMSTVRKSVSALKEGPNVMRDLAAGIKLSRRGELGPRTLAAIKRAQDFTAKWGETDRAYSSSARRFANHPRLNEVLASGEWNWYMGRLGKLMGIAKMPVEAISNLFKKGDQYYKYMEEEIGLSANSLQEMERLAARIDKIRSKPKDQITDLEFQEIGSLQRRLTQQPVYSFLLRRMYSPDHPSVQPGSQLHNYYKSLYYDEVIGKPGEILVPDTFRQVTGMEHLKPEFLEELVGMAGDAWGLNKQRFGRDLRIAGVREFESSGNLLHKMQQDDYSHFNHVRQAWERARSEAGDNWNGISAEGLIDILRDRGVYRKGLKIKDSSIPGHVLVSFSTKSGNELLGGINVVSRINTKDGGALMLGSDKLDILGPKANLVFGVGKNEDFVSVIFKDTSLRKADEGDISYQRRDWHNENYADAQELLSLAHASRTKIEREHITKEGELVKRRSTSRTFKRDGYWYGEFRDRDGNFVTRSTGLPTQIPYKDPKKSGMKNVNKNKAESRVEDWAREEEGKFRLEAQDISDIYPVSYETPVSGKPITSNPLFDPTGKTASAFPFMPWGKRDIALGERDLSLLGRGKGRTLESMEDALRGWTGRKTDTWRTGEIPESYNLRQRELEDYLSRISLAGKVALPGLLQEREF